MHTRTILVATLIVISVGIMPGNALADDKWSNRCRDAPLIDSGQFSGTVTASDDYESFKLRLSRGEYFSFKFNAPEESRGINLLYQESHGGRSTLDPDMYGFRGVVNAGQDDPYIYPKPGQSSWEFWAKQDFVTCVVILSGGWKTRYDWKFTIERSDPDVSLYDVRQLEDRVVKLRNQIDDTEKENDRIKELRSLLEKKNQTISELESRIEELESQSSPEGGSGDVTIEVAVNPADGQQNFVEGGKAIVEARSENADVSEMVVEYGSGTYQLDSSGEVAIPLADPGTQEMTLVYGDTTRQVSINVQAQQNQQPTQQQDSNTEVNTPGFGITIAVIALLGGALLLGRYR